jgi:hypothetical protein
MSEWVNFCIVMFLGAGMLYLMSGLIFVYPRLERQPSEPWQLLTTIIGIFGGALGTQRLHPPSPPNNTQNTALPGSVNQAEKVIFDGIAAPTPEGNTSSGTTNEGPNQSSQNTEEPPSAVVSSAVSTPESQEDTPSETQEDNP